MFDIFTDWPKTENIGLIHWSIDSEKKPWQCMYRQQTNRTNNCCTLCTCTQGNNKLNVVGKKIIITVVSQVSAHTRNKYNIYYILACMYHRLDLVKNNDYFINSIMLASGNQLEFTGEHFWGMEKPKQNWADLLLISTLNQYQSVVFAMHGNVMCALTDSEQKMWILLVPSSQWLSYVNLRDETLHKV